MPLLSTQKDSNSYNCSKFKLPPEKKYPKRYIENLKERNYPKQVKAKVDSWRIRPEEWEKKIPNFVEPKSRKRPQSQEEKYLSRVKTEKMLEEVNLLLTMSEVDRNLKTSKTYLRSVQKALNQSLRKSNHMKQGIELSVLNNVIDPYDNQKYGMSNTISESSYFERSQNSKYETIDSNRTSENSQSDEFEKEEKKEENIKKQNSSKVKTLLSFWNEKFASRPMTVCNDHYNPQRYLSLAKQHKRIIQLSNDGVDEEHLLKPSQVKNGCKGAKTIVEAIKMNSKSLRKIQSATSNEKINLPDSEDISFKTCSENMDESDNNKISGLFWNTHLLNKNKWLNNYVKNVFDTNKREPVKKKLRMTEMLKVENLVPITYPYSYVVKCLVEYTDEMTSLRCLSTPGIYRPVPKMTIISQPVDLTSCIFNRRYFNLRDYRALPSPKDSGEEISIERIAYITGIKPEVLSTLVEIINKKDKNVYTVSKPNLERLYNIGNESNTHKIFDLIRNIFVINNEYIKAALYRTVSYLSELPPAVTEINFRGIQRIQNIDRFYITVACILVIFLAIFLTAFKFALLYF